MDIEITAIIVVVLFIIVITLIIVSIVSMSSVIDNGIKSGLVAVTTFISSILIGSLIVAYGYTNLERGRWNLSTFRDNIDIDEQSESS